MTGKALVAGAFDYRRYDPAVADQLRQAAAHIRNRGHDQNAAIIDIGSTLLRVKDKVGWGRWGSWLAQEFSMSVSTAGRYMRVAEWAADKIVTVTKLLPTTLYLLSAKSTPASLAQEVLDRVDTDDPLSDREIKRRLARGKEAKRAAEPNPLAAAMRAVKALAPEDLTVLLMDAVKSLSPEALVDFLTDTVKGLSPGALIGFLARMRETYPPEPTSVGRSRASAVQPTPPEPRAAPKITKPSPPASEPTAPLITAWGAVPEKNKWRVWNWVMRGYALDEDAPAGTPQSFVDVWTETKEAEKKAFRVEMLPWKAAA